MKPRTTWAAGRLAAAIVALVVVSSTALAQDYTVRMKYEDNNIIETNYVSRNAVRHVSSDPMTQTDVIYRLDRGSIIFINHRQKTYGEITPAELRQLIDQKTRGMSPQQQEMMRRLGSNTAPTVTDLGPGETILGYATEKYSIKTAAMGMGQIQGEIWVAPALPYPPGYKDLTSALASMPGMGQLSPLSTAEKTAKGFILKSSLLVSFSPMAKGRPITKIASSVEKGPIPPSTFEPPAGYQKRSSSEAVSHR